MKDAMSNVDIRIMMDEMREAAQGAFIKNVYQYGDVFVLKVYQPGEGTFQLLIEPGHRIHLTNYRRVAPKMPRKFVSVLRKYLRDRRIIAIEQHELDRIVTIEVGDEEESHKLVAELFGRGNLLLLDNDDVIFIALQYRKMRDRDLVPKEVYEFPPQRGSNVFKLDDAAIEDVLTDSDWSVIRTLTRKLNLDSLSCEEICALAGVEAGSKMRDIEEGTLEALKQGIEEFGRRIRGGVDEPRIIYDEDDESEPIAFVPFRFETFNEHPQTVFDSFSQTLDEYFGVTEEEMDQETPDIEALQEERRRLKTIIEKQQENVDVLLQKAEELRKAGELVYMHFQIVTDILETIREARSEGVSWEEIERTIGEGKKQGNEVAQRIAKIVPSQGEVVVELQDQEIVLDIRKTPQENASRAYESAKKAEHRVEGAKKQIAKTREKLSDLDLSDIEETEEPVPIKVRKKRWYEKYRWFISSEDYLVIGGRDARTNETIAKKHMGPNDVFLHAAVHGAPYTVIKVPDKPPGKQTLWEAAQFAITFSRAWQDGLTAGDAYWVNPEQVSFTPPSGEYLPSGAVMIYGNKNFLKNVPVELRVGVLLEEEHAIPFSGPPTAVEANTQYHVKVVPGGDKKGQLVKDIMNALELLVPDNQTHLVSRMPEEEMMRVLPPGEGVLKR
jgi:predicted ribosome quality control (RQC) complex YloA/Tae2 family protein